MNFRRFTDRLASSSRRRTVVAFVIFLSFPCVKTYGLADERAAERQPGAGSPAREVVRPNQPARLSEKADGESALAQEPLARLWPTTSRQDLMRSAQTVVLFGMVSLVPVAVLMLTAFVRINIVLILLRQALGSPQVPGNQVLTALALLLTALVMRPTAEVIYHDAVKPYLSNEINEQAAWAAGSQPIKTFMVREVWKANHQHYLQALSEYDTRSAGGSGATISWDLALAMPLRVVAPAFLLSELTEALLIGFYLYLPFLVIDLVVAAVLAASGLFMLPPSLIATPLKLVLFVLADGWFEVAKMILSGYGVASTG